MTETMPTSEVLNRAADLIEERGWGTGPMSWAGCTGPICIDEALAIALGFEGCNTPYDGGIWPMDLDETEVVRALRSHIDASPDLYDLYCWNDAVGRSATEVIETLRACAVIEASRQPQAVTA